MQWAQTSTGASSAAAEPQPLSELNGLEQKQQLGYESTHTMMVPVPVY